MFSYVFSYLYNIFRGLFSSMKQVKIDAIYCGAWGYDKKFAALISELASEFDREQFVMTEEATPGNTGFFEIRINGKLVHSKKDGDGYVDTEAKYRKIADAIAAALEAWVPLWSPVVIGNSRGRCRAGCRLHDAENVKSRRLVICWNSSRRRSMAETPRGPSRHH